MDSFDVERLIAEAQRLPEGLDEAHRRLLAVTGRAQDGDKLVTVECTSQGITELEIAPRAMRWGSERLAKTIKGLIAESLADLQRQSNAILTEVLGSGSSADLMSGDNPANARLVEAEALFDQGMEQAMSELDRLRRLVEGS